MAVNVDVKNFKQKIVYPVATNVTSGQINRNWQDGRQMTYLCTIRATGENAPTVEQMKNEGFKMFQDNPEQEKIESSAAIDIYVYCDDAGQPGDQGKLTVWTVS